MIILSHRKEKNSIDHRRIERTDKSFLFFLQWSLNNYLLSTNQSNDVSISIQHLEI